MKSSAAFSLLLNPASRGVRFPVSSRFARATNTYVGNLTRSVSLSQTYSGTLTTTVTSHNAYQYWGSGDYKQVQAKISGVVSYETQTLCRANYQILVFRCKSTGHSDFLQDIAQCTLVGR